MAAVISLLRGALTKDITSLYATVKMIGFTLYAPAIVFLFPSLPQWIDGLFPTYYVVASVMAISQPGTALADVAGDLAILIALLIVMTPGLLALVSRTRLQIA